jgi:methyl-accepting chemotaxis protein
VKDLADQSNMLALNAAIEAVRSGEHGKGFGVVAREIRSLADQSIHATQQVREMLDDISEAIRGAVAITENGSQRIDAGLEQVKTSGEQLSQLSNIVKENSQAVRQINSAVGQQNGAIAQILGALTDQSTLMRDTMTRLEATDDAVKTISNASISLVHIVDHFAAGARRND